MQGTRAAGRPDVRSGRFVIRDMVATDAIRISDALAAIGWDKPVTQYEQYLAEIASGAREVLVAESDGEFVGYLCIVWESHYPPFREQSIPEIVDFNVLPAARRAGVGSRLMDEAEARVALRSHVVGIGVGMYPDYGPAQRMYVKRGYVPDGRGLCYDGTPVAPMAQVRNDDSLNLLFTKRLSSTPS